MIQDTKSSIKETMRMKKKTRTCTMQDVSKKKKKYEKYRVSAFLSLSFRVMRDGRVSWLTECNNNNKHN